MKHLSFDSREIGLNYIVQNELSGLRHSHRIFCENSSSEQENGNHFGGRYCRFRLQKSWLNNDYAVNHKIWDESFYEFPSLEWNKNSNFFGDNFPEYRPVVVDKPKLSLMKG